jgi:hypothetical protein
MISFLNAYAFAFVVGLIVAFIVCGAIEIICIVLAKVAHQRRVAEIKRIYREVDLLDD